MKINASNKRINKRIQSLSNLELEQYPPLDKRINLIDKMSLPTFTNLSNIKSFNMNINLTNNKLVPNNLKNIKTVSNTNIGSCKTPRNIGTAKLNKYYNKKENNGNKRKTTNEDILFSLPSGNIKKKFLSKMNLPMLNQKDAESPRGNYFPNKIKSLVSGESLLGKKQSELNYNFTLKSKNSINSLKFIRNCKKKKSSMSNEASRNFKRKIDIESKRIFSMPKIDLQMNKTNIYKVSINVNKSNKLFLLPPNSTGMSNTRGNKSPIESNSNFMGDISPILPRKTFINKAPINTADNNENNNLIKKIFTMNLNKSPVSKFQITSENISHIKAKMKSKLCYNNVVLLKHNYSDFKEEELADSVDKLKENDSLSKQIRKCLLTDFNFEYDEFDIMKINDDYFKSYENRINNFKDCFIFPYFKNKLFLNRKNHFNDIDNFFPSGNLINKYTRFYLNRRIRKINEQKYIMSNVNFKKHYEQTKTKLLFQNVISYVGIFSKSKFYENINFTNEKYKELIFSGIFERNAIKYDSDNLN